MNQKEAIYQKYADLLKEKLVHKYYEYGLNASGNYEDELEEEIKPRGFTLFGAQYSEYMDRGRGAGGDYKKIAPLIRGWIEVKTSLPQFFRDNKESLSFAIAYRIAEEGIQVPNEYNKGAVVSMVVNDFLAKDIENLIDEVGEVEVQMITSQITKVFTEMQAEV